MTRRIITVVLGLALRVFFRRIEVAGLEHIPPQSPVIFVLNHPNGLVDPVFILCLAPRRVSFLAKAPLFRMPVIGYLVRALDSLPVYRKQDEGEDPSRNRETFELSRALLKRGGTIAICPEGISHNEPRLMPLKSGAARIALSAASAGERLDIKIVPAGLYYTEKTTFRSAALLYFGEPIRVEPVALDAGGAALVNYTLTAEDVAGPFTPVPAGMKAKAKLDKLGYASVEEALGEKFHASPALLKTLNPGKDMATAGTELVVPNVTDVAAPAKAAKVVVDKSDLTVSLVDAAGDVYAQFPASTGSKNDPLPIGEWKINGVAMNPVFNYNPKLFWDANPKDQKAKIPAGPNNPVGIVWVDLSKEHYGIHGTPEPSRISKSESHGCIRLTNWTANMLAKAVAPGLPAVLQE